jgi:hypothetical protein
VKTRIYSWLLAGAYLLWGLWLYRVISSFQSFYSGFSVSLPFFTGMIFAVGPFGWLCLAMANGLIVIFKDRKFRSRFWNPLFTFLLLLWVGCMTLALLLISPMFRGITQIH